MARRLNFVWCSVRDDPEVDAIVLSGAGAEAFSVGFDRADRPSVPVTPRECGVDKRLVVAVNGVACREALQLVEQADVVVASAHARFLAAAPDLVGPRLTTRGSTGTAPAPITAEHALRSGLADDVVPLASLHRRAAELATSLDHPHTQHRRRNLT
ncbi:enoyl-CoA hydratase/isomerase family protein [Streptomyces sp. GC420]|uniref:enoyl-CoA hydratase/isomerase family protein n=1 Tax=Streptomyces sp. GC420 TaxID=2697568 RepID=UPI00141504F6|nr:enoyl-CoA hydratase/isomerase family protein [Streptomyces sp. GC420]NBM14221.1 hypothetical protein [Streptomyces sp. GC420]